MSDLTPKATFLNEIKVTTIVKLYNVKCPLCKKEFVTQRWGVNNKINAIPCKNKECSCLFNVQWVDDE